VAATYRGNGQVETLTDGEGNRTTYSFDGHDRRFRGHYIDLLIAVPGTLYRSPDG
jgi:YD repeat-containing protein